jgi:hypothetical protein
MALLALNSKDAQADVVRDEQNPGTDSLDPKPNLSDSHTVLFQPIGDSRHLQNSKQTGFFPDSNKQAVSFIAPQQLMQTSGTSLSLDARGPRMEVRETTKQKIKSKKNRKDRNLREAESGSDDEEQEYTTIAMSSDDGKAYAHCAIFPDGKMVACLQYIHNGVQNTTMVMIDPNDFGSHTLTTVTPDEQRKYFAGMNMTMEAPLIPPNEAESRLRRLEAEKVNSQESALPRRSTAGVIPELTVAVAVDPSSMSTLGGMSNAQAQIAIQISLLNQALQNSGVRLRTKLVSIIQNPVDGGGDSQYELRHATANIDRGDADVLISIIGGYGSSVAWLYNEKPLNAVRLKDQLVSVVRLRMLPGKTLLHEFGHNIAGQHQPQYSYRSGRRFPYAYAYSDYYEEVGDILAYLNNPINRFLIFSGATNVYENIRVGDANTDNSRAMNIVAEEMWEILNRQAEVPGTPRPTVAVYPSTRPTTPSKAPSRVRTNVPTTAKAPTAPSKAPTVRKAPTVPSKAPTAPTKQRTTKPTVKATAAPTFDQTPLLPIDKLVDFAFKVDDPSANIPLTIQIGSARKVTITTDGRVTVLNAANAPVSQDNYVVDSAVLEKIKLNAGNNNNFRLINTGTEVNLYHVPFIKKRVRGKPIHVLGQPKLLLVIHKISENGNNMLGDNLPITFSRVAAEHTKVGAIKNVATRAPARGRLLEDEPVPGAVINFIDLSNDPEVETKKFVLGEYDPVLKVISGSPDNILKFIDDAIFSLGEKEAYKLMGSGVMSKIFDFADKKGLRKVFKQLHHYHKVEFIQYVKYAVIDSDRIFKQASAMRAADLKFGDWSKTEDPKAKIEKPKPRKKTH